MIASLLRTVLRRPVAAAPPDLTEEQRRELARAVVERRRVTQEHAMLVRSICDENIVPISLLRYRRDRQARQSL